MTNPIHLIHLDEVGEDAAKALKKGQASVRAAQEKLRQIWAAFDKANQDKVPVQINGCKNKSEWAEHFKISLRYCQYVVRDGSRRNQRKANSVRQAKPTDSGFLARIAETKKRLTEIQSAVDTYVRGDEDLRDQIDTAVTEVFNEFLALIAPDGYEIMTADNGWTLSKKDRAQPAATPAKKSPAKKHANNPAKSGTSLCGKQLVHKTTAFDGEEVTCKACLMQQGMDEIRKPQDVAAKEGPPVADVLPDCPTENQGE